MRYVYGSIFLWLLHGRKRRVTRGQHAARPIATSWVLLTVLLDENMKPDQIPAEMSQRMLAGGADFVAEQVQARVLDAGIDGVIINMPFYVPGAITAAAEALRPLVAL